MHRAIRGPDHEAVDADNREGLSRLGIALDRGDLARKIHATMGTLLTRET